MPKTRSKANGLPKIGDKVLYRPNDKGPWKDDWKVAAVLDTGPLMVRIENSKGESTVVSLCGNVYYFLPPGKELPAELRSMRRRDHTEVSRNFEKNRFRDRPVYDVLCTRCMSVYKIREGYIEEADLIHDGDRFRSSKPQIVDALGSQSGRHLRMHVIKGPAGRIREMAMRNRPMMNREFRIIDTTADRTSQSFSKVPTNMSATPVVIRDDDDYRVVALGRCLCQVRRIATRCFRYSSCTGEEGVVGDLHEAFLKLGYKLVINPNTDEHTVFRVNDHEGQRTVEGLDQKRTGQ